MSTLAVVEEILHETLVPMTVREIVDRAGVRLPSKSKTPETVVARDLAMDIKKHGEGSLFIRTSPGRYTLRALVASRPSADSAPGPVDAKAALVGEPDGSSWDRVEAGEPVAGESVARKPAVAAASAGRSISSRDSADGGGYAG